MWYMQVPLHFTEQRASFNECADSPVKSYEVIKFFKCALPSFQETKVV